MKQKIKLVLGLLMLSINLMAQNPENNLLGQWTNESHDRVLQFVKQGNTYNAIIRKAKDHKMIGKEQISGLKQIDENTFNDGTLYLINKGKTVKCSVKMLNKNLMELKASSGFFSKSQQWQRM